MRRILLMIFFLYIRGFVSGLSDHDAQIIAFTNICNSIPRQYPPITGKLIVTQHTILRLC